MACWGSWWCRVPWLCVNRYPGMAWTCVGGGCWTSCRVGVLWYGGGGGRWMGRCCWCAPAVSAWDGAAWLDLGPGWGAVPCLQARWRV